MMRWMQADDGGNTHILLDVNQPGYGSDSGVYRTGKYTGQLAAKYGAFKEGWRVEGYIWTEGETVVGRYTRVFPPAGAKDAGDRLLPGEIPVCIVLGTKDGVEKREGSKPGAAVLPREATARFIHGEWPQP